MHGSGGASCLHVSGGLLRDILPLFPNLQFGYLSNFDSERGSADYLMPFSLGAASMIFGEVHIEL